MRSFLPRVSICEVPTLLAWLVALLPVASPTVQLKARNKNWNIGLLLLLFVQSALSRLNASVILLWPRLDPLSLSKDKVRVAEGTAVVQDQREPSRLGVSFSYCERSSSSSRSSHFCYCLPPLPLLLCQFSNLLFLGFLLFSIIYS